MGLLSILRFLNFFNDNMKVTVKYWRLKLFNFKTRGFLFGFKYLQKSLSLVFHIWGGNAKDEFN